MLAVENFGYSSGALNGLSVGIGWAGPWQVQNGSVAVPGYNVSSTTPLTAAGTAQSGGYAVGGLNYQTSGRSLDASATGPFAPYVSAGLIGKSGTSLFFSFLMRQDKNTNDEISLTLHPGGSPAWAVSSPGVQVGYFGGTRFWGLKLDGVVRPTKIPVVTGQAALMVVRIDFAATSTVSLYVNPSLTALPTAASVAATTTKSIAFQSLAYYGGPASGESSVDEIRFSGTYLGLGLKSIAPPSAPTGLTATPGNTQVSLAWTAVSGATSYKVYAGVAGGTAQLQSTQTTTAFTVGGLTNSVGYSFYVVAMNATGTGPVSATVNATPRGVAPTPHPTLGTNLAELKDYSRSWPMVDAFKMARPWISQLQGASWGGGPALALDANGWIKSLAPGQYAETITGSSFCTQSWKYVLDSFPGGHSYPVAPYGASRSGSHGSCRRAAATAAAPAPGDCCVRKRWSGVGRRGASRGGQGAGPREFATRFQGGGGLVSNSPRVNQR